MTPVERLIATLRGEIGYIEKATNEQLDEKLANPGKNNWTKYARDLDALGDFYNGRKAGYDWCDVFTDHCFVTTFGKEMALKLLCAPIKSCGAGVKWSAQYFENAGRFYEADPEPGDQIFFGDASSWWHTGVVVEVVNGRVYTIEGNTSGNTGVISNGGCVAMKSYPLNYKYIKGYGRPDYSIVEEEDEMTQDKFNEMMDAWLKRQAEKPPFDWSEEARSWAEGNGLIRGDENGNKQYQSFCTREQLMTFLHRLTNMLKGGEV